MSVIDGGKTPWYAASWLDDIEGAAKGALEASGFAAAGTFKDEDEDPWVDWSGIQTALDEKNTWSGFAKSVDFEPLNFSHYLNMIPPPAYSSGYADGGPIGPAKWDPQPHQCPHCLRPRHPGPLTRTVASMLGAHQFDPDYDPDKDDSPILCVGADYQGPVSPNGQSKSFIGTIQGAPWVEYTDGSGNPWTIADLNALKMTVNLYPGTEQK